MVYKYEAQYIYIYIDHNDFFLKADYTPLWSVHGEEIKCV